MPLAAATLSASIRSKLLADPDSQAQDNDALTALCDAVAEAVVEHIVASGEINTITSCPAGAGTGTGTIS